LFGYGNFPDYCEKWFLPILMSDKQVDI
jgi:hypothetical protein